MHIDNLEKMIHPSEYVHPRMKCSKAFLSRKYIDPNLNDPEDKTILNRIIYIEEQYQKTQKIDKKKVLEYNRLIMCLVPETKDNNNVSKQNGEAPIF
jgi:hypothetical protein